MTRQKLKVVMLQALEFVFTCPCVCPSNELQSRGTSLLASVSAAGPTQPIVARQIRDFDVKSILVACVGTWPRVLYAGTAALESFGVRSYFT